MKVKTWLTLLVWALVALTGFPARALAQTDSGRIAGTVTDQSRGFVGEASIKVTNEKTGEVRIATSNAEGFFVVPSLKPSTYTIAISKAGFAPLEYTEMPVTVGQELALDFELQVTGGVEALTVTAAAPVLETSSAKVGATVTEREVQNLPINGRQMSQLMLQAPGSLNTGTGTYSEIRFSGRALEQNVIKYDGVEASGIIDAAPGQANGENQSLFKLQQSLENVQEFRIESSNYPAEFGTGTGGQISVISKSGSNRYTGSIFEYLRRDELDAANYFDSRHATDGTVTVKAGSSAQVPKSSLKLDQFGGSMGGPLVKNRAFFFASYEGYQLNASKNIIQAVPSQAQWNNAVASIKPLQAGFLASDAQIIQTGVDPNFDLAQWQPLQDVSENAFGLRVDYRINDRWSSYVRFFHDQATSLDPQDVSGRYFRMTIDPSNAVFNLTGILGNGMINDFKVGYNAAPSTEGAKTQPGFENMSLSLSGSATISGVAGQGNSSGLASPGGLIRANSAGNGRGAPYDPYSLTFADSVSRIVGSHFVKVGADVRMIRMTTDQLGGITYTFSNVTSFMAGTPSRVQYFGDLSEPSPFHDGASGDRRINQEYYVAFAQDEWRVKPNLTLNYGLRYDYYSPLHESDNRVVKFNIDTGVIDPETTPFYKSKKNSFQPRLSATYAMTPRTVVKGGFGIFVGPGQTEDQIQPIEADRINTTASSGAFNVYPVDPASIRTNFTTNPNTRAFQPRSYANEYTLPEKVYQYTASLQREIGWRTSATVAYVGSQGRNLFLRSIGNRTIGVLTRPGTAAAFQVREFDIVTCNDGTVLTGSLCLDHGAISSLQTPYAEVDIKTSGGHDSYNAMQLAMSRRSSKGVSLNAQYTFGVSRGTTTGSNDANTAGNNARTLDEFEYEMGYNNFDVRHLFNASAFYELPGSGMLTGGWSVAGIATARSGLPVEVLIARNDVVYKDNVTGLYFLNPADGRTAVVNTPGGGFSRARRRPDVIPGVNPFIEEGGLQYLNPAAFAIPQPGTFGNMERGSIKGPNFWQADLMVSKRITIAGSKSAEFRMEVFNIFNHTNFAGIGNTLGTGLPTNATTEANTIQPGQAYTQGAAGTAFGRASSTVGTTVGIGTNRQIQLAFRLNF